MPCTVHFIGKFEMNKLVKPETIYELIAKYEQNMKNLEAFKAAYDKVAELLIAQNRSRARIDYPATLTQLQKKAWLEIILKAQLFEVMSIERADEVSEALYNPRTSCESVGIPVFNYDNVVNFIEQQRENIPQMVNEKIIEVYSILRPANYHKLKTNKTSLIQGIGKKVILSYYFEHSFGGGLSIRYEKRERINAIQEVFLLLDDKRIPRDKDKLYNKLYDSCRGQAYEDEYFKIRGFNNGNMHLEFKRSDIVDKIMVKVKDRLLSP